MIFFCIFRVLSSAERKFTCNASRARSADDDDGEKKRDCIELDVWRVICWVGWEKMSLNVVEGKLSEEMCQRDKLT